MTKRLYSMAALFLCLVFCLMHTGCVGKTTTDEAHSPNLIGAEITSFNKGSLSEQFVKVTLEFDRAVRIAERPENSFRITIAKERVSEDDYILLQGDRENEAELLISVEAVTTGVLSIERSEKADVISDLTDETGQYAVHDFTLEGIIPSGVTLSTVSAGDTNVTKQVDTAWNIRSIAWVCLTRNGEVIPVNTADAGDEMDGRAAVHGHEFLSEDTYTVAEKMVDVLEHSYSANEFAFSRDGNRVTAAVLNEDTAEYDIRIYQYLKINGEEVFVDSAEETGAAGYGSEEAGETGQIETPEESDEDTEISGLKIKVPEIDREPTPEEQAFLDRLHIARIPDEAFPDGSALYSVLTITGDAMPEEEIYSVNDLEGLIELSFENEAMYSLNLPVQTEVDGKTCYGLDLVRFLELCGMDAASASLYMTLEMRNQTEETIDLARLIETGGSAMLLFADEDAPFFDGSEPLAGTIACVCGGTAYGGVCRITAGTEAEPYDPEYRFHNRLPWSEDLDQAFSVEVYQSGAEYLGALISETFTTADLEQLMRDHPESVVGNYYGIIGDMGNYPYMGTGGWLDYFEGVDLYWLLTEEVGLDHLGGSAELYGRDMDLYTQIDDLAAYFYVDDPSEYYILTQNGVRIPGTVPMIACTKNGYPILRGHIHDVDGYISYNYMNQQLEYLGISTEIGVVKNHNGPFTACLGNLAGVYGGNQVETGGDCCLIRIYLD